MSARVLAITLDAMDASLALRWMRAGRLPTLAGLADSGSLVPLSTDAEVFPDGVFSSFTTGSNVGEHWLYSWRCVRPRSYSMVLRPERSYRKPFWEVARRASDARLILLDVQHAPALREGGVTQVIGWGERVAQRHESWPPDLYDDIVARHGRSPVWLDDDATPRTDTFLRRYLRTILGRIDARTSILIELLQERPWNLCVASYHEAHNGAHVFHRFLDPLSWAHGGRRAERFGGALLAIYERIDAGLGRILEAVPADTDVLVFSLQSMRANANGLHLLPRVLTGLGYQVPPGRPPLTTRGLNAVSEAVPWFVRRHLNARVPPEVRRRALERMWAQSTDWSRTRAVAETATGATWVRINLRGREPRGTVEPGPEYEALCDEIAGELEQLVDAETGRPAVAQVRRAAEVAHGAHVGELPDLHVAWPPDGRFIRAVQHPRFGVVRETARDVAFSEHGGDGFLFTTGPSLRSGGGTREACVFDLAPTILYLMGSAVPEALEGSVLTDLIAPELLAARPVQRSPIDVTDNPWR